MPTFRSQEAGFVAVLGDLVRSRNHKDRATLQQALKGALGEANHSLMYIQPLTITIGDEFQGLYSSVSAALEATLLVRLALLSEADVRFGVGWGPLTSYSKQQAPFEQDGPAWWAARDAVNRAARLASQREAPRGVRTVFLAASPESAEEVDAEQHPPADPNTPRPLKGDWQGLINSFLVCRDQLVSSMSARDAEVLRGIWEGDSLSTIASLMGISLSAVSQRAVRSGAYAVRYAHETLREAVP
jgi:hypothetical protein